MEVSTSKPELPAQFLQECVLTSHVPFPMDDLSSVVKMESLTCQLEDEQHALVMDMVQEVYLRDDNSYTITHEILGEAFPELKHMTLQEQLTTLILLNREHRSRASPQQQLQVVEYCAGVCAISRAAWSAGMPAAARDLIHSAEHDMRSASGLRLWVLTLLCSAPDATIWLAPSCCSWIWLTRSVTKRNKRRVWGDTTREFVRNGN